MRDGYFIAGDRGDVWLSTGWHGSSWTSQRSEIEADKTFSGVLERTVIYCRGEQSRSITAAVNRRRKGVRKEAKRKSAYWGGRGGQHFWWMV